MSGGVERAGSIGARPQLNAPPPAEAASPRSIERRPEDATKAQAAELLRCASSGSMIEALQILNRDLQKGATTESILNKKQGTEAARVKIDLAVARAAREAEEAAEQQSITDTLKNVAKVATVAAAVASVALTGGASTPALIALAGTLISTFSKDINQAAGGNAISEKILTYGGAGLSVGAGGVGLYLNGAATAAATANTTMSVTDQVASAVSKGAGIVGATAMGMSAYTGYRAATHGANEVDARADETALRAQRKQMMRDVELLIDTLKEVEKSFNTSLSALASARENEAASNLTLSAGIRA